MKPIFLWGYMASGKSRLGKRLANKLDFEFIDLDKTIEIKMDMVVSEIFNQFGEAYFRELEKSVLTELIEKEDCIISCGGGTPCFLDNHLLMKENGLVIYLDVEETVLLDRLWRNRHERPIVAKMKNREGLKSFVQGHLSSRMEFYSHAHHQYDNTIPKSRLEEMEALIKTYQ